MEGALPAFEERTRSSCGNTEIPVVLGVDGGATSTSCICLAIPQSDVFSEPPPVLAQALAGCSNRNSVGETAAQDVLKQVMAETLMKAHCSHSSVKSVCLSVSGVDHPSDQQSLLQWLRGLFPGDVELCVHNDAVAALASGTLGRLHGCVLIAGTGTIAYGVAESGQEARAAGVGPLLGEHGSGYSIAQQALAAVMRAHDGRGPSTILTQAILEKLELSSPDEIIGWAYADSSWAHIAAIAPSVKACATMGDPIASKILHTAVDELVGSVKAVVNRLKLAGEDGTKSFPLVMVGGLLETDEGWDLSKHLISNISKIFPGIEPIRPQVEPAVGAALLALASYFRSSNGSVKCNGKR